MERGIIGGFAPRTPFLMAPMAGISDTSFRQLCQEAGAALCYTEMVSAKALHFGSRNTEELLAVSEAEATGEHPVAFQLFGSEPDIMAEAVEILEERPNVLFDLNMGCPVPKIVRNGEGSALMREPMLAARIVEAMKAKSSKPVTVKIRAGWDSESVNAVEFARVLEAAGADAVCVHGRTREQYYSGQADWGLIAEVKAAVRIPVIGNGDVRSGADAVRMLQQTGCDYVMIARGALGNPWIFAEATSELEAACGERRDVLRGDERGCDDGVRQATSDVPVVGRAGVSERAAMFLRHTRLVCEDKGEYTALREMRKHAGWYFKGLPGAAALRGAVCKAETIEALVALVRGLELSHQP